MSQELESGSRDTYELETITESHNPTIPSCHVEHRNDTDTPRARQTQALNTEQHEQHYDQATREPGNVLFIQAVSGESSGGPESGLPVQRGSEESIFHSLADDTTTEEPTSTARPSLESEHASRLPMKESLGFFGLLRTFGGSIIILGALSILFFLWLGHGSREAADATWAWRKIALHGWMTQAVTLTSLLIRITVSMQSVVCTSMLAALVLEKRYTRKSDVAWFSVTRSTNDGPLAMVHMMMLSKSLVKCIEFWLLLSVALITLGLQFSSTILLSDFTDFAIRGNNISTQMPDLIDIRAKDLDVTLSVGSFIQQKPVYGIIGEVKTDVDVYPNEQGLSQTGLVQRGFLPFSDMGRQTSIRYYEGNAMVLSSNVACLPPEIDDISVYTPPETNGAYAIMEATLHYGPSIAKVQNSTDVPCSSEGCDKIRWTCQIPATVSDNPDSWASVVCFIGAVGEEIDLGVVKGTWNHTEAPWTGNTMTMLVISSNVKDWNLVQMPQPFPSGLASSEWTSYEITPGRFLNTTLCFPAYSIDRKAVTMEASWDLRQPSTEISYASQQHSTLDIQRYMGLDSPRHTTFADRGILDMHIMGEPDDGPPTGPANEVREIVTGGALHNETSVNVTSRLEEWTQYVELSAVAQPNTTWILCIFCSVYGIGTHPEVALLFNDIISRTGRAAHALQSLQTAEALGIHYAYLDSYDLLHEAQTVSTIIVRAPSKCGITGCVGLASVVTLLGLHLLSVAVITILYIMQVRHSRYANIWHAISQLVNDGMGGILDAANAASDKDVFKDHGQRKDGDRFVKLVKLENGRIEVAEHLV